ncbi:hypothetical protein F383_31518 [Gossypium arboreum]|jgi:hypothetical protein
MPTY